MNGQASKEPASSLITGILGDAETLLRKEIALAKEEVREEMRDMRGQALRLGGGGVVLHVSAILLALGLAGGLAQLLSWPAWGGYAVVGLVLAAVGYGVTSMAAGGVKRDARDVGRKVRQLKEEMKHDIRSLRPAAIVGRED